MSWMESSLKLSPPKMEDFLRKLSFFRDLPMQAKKEFETKIQMIPVKKG